MDNRAKLLDKTLPSLWIDTSENVFHCGFALVCYFCHPFVQSPFSYDSKCGYLDKQKAISLLVRGILKNPI